MIETPEIYTSRYLASNVLASGEVVPVRAGLKPPIVPLSYTLEETAEALLPDWEMLSNWTMYWKKLDSVGLVKIGEELAAISECHGGKPLALLDHEDLTKAQRSPRVVFAAWWEEQAGWPVYELTDDGERLHHTELPRQVRPKKPKRPEEDRRWTHDPVRPWPLSHQDVEEWVRGRYWQYARTMPKNAHSYTRRDWGDERMFERIVLHIREHGEQEIFGGREYTYYRAAGRKVWTQQNPLPVTTLINCKFDDPEEQVRLAEEQTGKSREKLGLKITPERQASQPRLSEIQTEGREE